MATITLADVLQRQEDPGTSGFMELFLKERPLAQYMHTKPVDTMVNRVHRERDLPDAAWRQLGSGFVADALGHEDFVEEGVFSIGKRLEVDHLIEKDKRLTEKPRARQERLFAKTLAYTFNDTIINSDPVASPDAPAGLKWRISKLDAKQTVDAGSATYGGDGVDLNLETAAARNAAGAGAAVIDVLNVAISRCNAGDADAILLSRTARLWIESAIMRSNPSLLKDTEDKFGRHLTTYDGIKMIDMGFKADRVTPIIPDTESGEGGTSIYVVKFGEDYFHMLEYLPLDRRDLGLLDDGLTLATIIEWAWGLAAPHPEFAVRIKNIKIA